MTKCSCDACEATFGDHEPRTPDGYCIFCSSTCYPPGNIAGKVVRAAMSKDAREHFHAAARVASHLPHSPMEAISSARQEAVGAFVRAVGPIVEREGKAWLGKLRDKIAGKK